MDSSAQPGESYPTPPVVSAMITSNTIDVDEIKKVMRGPRCFLCYDWITFFTCSCKKSYHRKCLLKLMEPGVHLAVLDPPLDVAKCEYGEAKLLKCPGCFMEQETLMPQMRQVSQEDLNLALNYFFGCFCDGTVLKSLSTGSSEPGPFEITATGILEKIKNKMYRSVEGFVEDLKRIKFNIVAVHTPHSEKAEAADLIIQTILGEMRTLTNCFECYLKRWDPVTRKIKSKSSYATANVEVCEKPHPLLWVREPGFPYWPTKFLSFDGKDLIVQCFNEEARCRKLTYPLATGYSVQVYSVEFPGTSKKPRSNNEWRTAQNGCRQYVENLKARFGEDGVVIPDKPRMFDGHVDKLFKDIFPRCADVETEPLRFMLHNIDDNSEVGVVATQLDDMDISP